MIIGTRAKNISLKSALDFVAGYTIANDVGAADIEARSSQWASGKMFDTFCPLGPAIVPPGEISDPHNLAIKTTLNEQIVQEGNTREMIFDVPFLIHYISQCMTLLPGGIISTGTPKGVSPMQPGDVVEVRIEGIGVLRNPVKAAA